jgi:outer membrane protein assembly factor BamB
MRLKANPTGAIMRNQYPRTGLIAGCVMLLSANAFAQDWPQWRGPGRDAKATGFNPPKTWPKALTQKWKVNVGDGVATPALVGDRLYVFGRENGNEVVRCIDAATGKEVWQDRYEAEGATPPAAAFSGPRSSPTVADGKVVTFGVRGTFSCYDAATGKKLWRKDAAKGMWPRFFASSSPIVVDGLCIAQLGGQKNGGITALDLATGQEKWKWAGDGPAYASPVLLTVDGAKLIVALTEGKIVAVNSADGKLVWETPFVAAQRNYNAATPIVDGQTIIYAGGGRGIKAVKIDKQGDGFTAKELWSNPKESVQFNTPVLKDGKLYGLSQTNEIFCVNADTGKTSWTASAGGAAPAGGQGGGRGRGGRGAGYGSIVDAGSILLVLTPSSELIVFEPNDNKYVEQARIKVADTPTYAYPVVSGNRLFVKDKDALILWTTEG